LAALMYEGSGRLFDAVRVSHWAQRDA